MDENVLQIAGQPATGKEQEFIDHSFLAPTYIRDSSTYIMELIDQLPKSEVPGESLDTLQGDIHFPNNLFQFVQQKPETTSSTAGSTLGAPKTSADNAAATNPTDFITTLNGDFLNTTERVNPGVEGAVVNSGVGEFNALALPPDLSVTLEDSLSDPDVLYNRVSSRKILPHKKRISRKLKGGADNILVGGNGPESPLAMPLEPQGAVEVRLSSDCAIRFSCELCGFNAASQLDFFAHLKQHYEPPSEQQHPMLAAMKTSLDSLERDKHCGSNMAAAHTKPDDPVFQDVSLNFVDFPSEVVNAPVVGQVLHAPTHPDAIKMLSTNYDPPNDGVIDDGSLKALQVDEFSDTEDMLEGIRNVVDKVSIEDTCDDIELSGMRATEWFTNDNLKDLGFNKANYGDLTFAGALEEAAALHHDEHTVPATNVSPVEEKAEKPKDESYTVFSGSQDEHNYDSVYDEVDDVGADETTNGDAENDEDKNAYDDHMQQLVSGDATPEKLPPAKAFPQHFCDECQRGFNSKNALAYHIRTHKGDRPHQCDVCGKSFYAVGALKSHIRTHTGDKPYECPECKRTFRQYADLKYHMTSLHSDVKSHQCEFCGKAFSRKYSLVLHRRIHTREKNYTCEHCGKSFSASVYLLNHRKIHTGEKPYECEVCSKKFRVSGDLSRHLKIHKQKPADQAKRSAPLKLKSQNTKLCNKV